MNASTILQDLDRFAERCRRCTRDHLPKKAAHELGSAFAALIALTDSTDRQTAIGLASATVEHKHRFGDLYGWPELPTEKRDAIAAALVTTWTAEKDGGTGR